ncbi:MAG: DoxX family protein [Chlamydiales bacterium]|nr:DoxX family protein [Chlamydiia bacterium]MCP5507559.1 DoxX family protein [Chlamydiales bacterium]
MQAIKSFYSGIVNIGDFFQHLVLLAFRLYWGWGFHIAGCNKFDNIPAVSKFFAGLGIPLPEVNAYIVASIECVGAWCLILGFASRLISIPLAAIMFVALAIAHSEGFAQFFSNPDNFLSQAPVTYLMATLVIFSFGPGYLSIDYLIRRFVMKQP